MSEVLAPKDFIQYLVAQSDEQEESLWLHTSSHNTS